MDIDRFETRSLPLSPAPELAEGEVHIWFTALDTLPILHDEAAPGRAQRLRQRRRSQQFVLRLLLGAYLGVPGRDVALERPPAGRPALAAAQAASGLDFNLSHAGDLFAVAIARDAIVGIDIEPRGRPVRALALARRWFSNEEADVVGRCNEPAGRIECLRRWTVREAVIKAHGGTIAEHFAEVRPSTEDPRRLDRVPPGWPERSAWDLRELTGAPEIVGFLAAATPLRSVRGFRLTLPGNGAG